MRAGTSTAASERNGAIMLRLITAPPGTGKTLLMVQMVYEYLNQGKQVYANIAGLNVPGVLPSPYDWRDLPNDSVVFYDEAHEHPAFAKEHGIVKLDTETHQQYRTRVNHVLDIGNSLSIHRHFGFHIIFSTQDAKEQIDSRLFGFFNEHIHLHRPFNATYITKYFWRKVQTSPDSQTAQKLCEVKTGWKYPKHLYNFYQSSSGEHNHKFKIPLKYLAFALVPIFLFGKGFANAKETGFLGLFGKSESEQQVAQEKNNQLTPQNATNPNQTVATGENLQTEKSIEQLEEKRVAMVSRSDGFYCRAYDGNGNLMQNIKYEDCVYYSDNPIAIAGAPTEKQDSNLQAANTRQDYSNQQNSPVGQMTPTVTPSYISASEKQTFNN